MRLFAGVGTCFVGSLSPSCSLRKGRLSGSLMSPMAHKAFHSKHKQHQFANHASIQLIETLAISHENA